MMIPNGVARLFWNQASSHPAGYRSLNGQAGFSLRVHVSQVDLILRPRAETPAL